MQPGTRSLVLGLLVSAIPVASVLVPRREAQAHFILSSPEAGVVMSALGDPLHEGPCGEGTGFTPSNVVTAYQTGGKLRLTITETIYHPGHYRVVLVKDRNDIPADPVVTLSGSGSNALCDTTAIQSPSMLPVLADNVFPHTAELIGPQSVDIDLPAGFTCDKCTLQVIEFTASHEPPCFERHCADITISTPAPPPLDAGTSSSSSSSSGGAPGGGAPDAGSNAAAGDGGDSGCSTTLASPASPFAAFAAAAFAVFAFVRSRRRTTR